MVLARRLHGKPTGRVALPMACMTQEPNCAGQRLMRRAKAHLEILQIDRAFFRWLRRTKYPVDDRVVIASVNMRRFELACSSPFTVFSMDSCIHDLLLGGLLRLEFGHDLTAPGDQNSV